MKSASTLVVWIEDNPVESLTIDESKEALIALLWLIHAPHSLMQFLSVIPQLSTILECLDELLDDEKSDLFADLDIKISDLILVAQHLKEHAEDLYGLFGEIIEAKPSLPNARHPMHNHLGRYYVYAAIMTTIEVENQEYEDLLNQLKATMLYCHAYLIASYFTPIDYINSPDVSSYQTKETGNSATQHACLFIRQSTHEGQDKDYLEGITEFKSFNQLLDNIELLRDDPIKPKVVTYFNPLIIRVFKSTSDSGHSNGGSNGRRGHRYIFIGWNSGFVRGSDGSFMEQASPYDEVSILTISADSSENLNDILDAGLVPEEDAVDEEMILIDDNNPKSVRILAKNQVKHLEMSNQHFMFDWHNNNISELTELLKLCGSIIRDHQSSDIQKQTVCLIMTSLVSGMGFDRVAANFRYRTNQDRFINSAISFIWNEESKSGVWVISPMLPRQEKHLSHEQRAYCEQQDKSMTLPDVFNIGSFIHATFTKEYFAKWANKKLFRHKYETYRREYRNILGRLSVGNRINEIRIQSHLFNTIVSQISGDVAQATLLSGRYHPLAKTRLHYSALSTKHLQEIYVSALQKMVSDVYAEGYAGKEAIPSEYIQNDSHVIGSEYCPRTDAVQNAVSNLISQLSEKPKDKSIKTIAKYHNAYTLYTVMMTGYCTGYRAVCDPFPAAPDIDKETGLCVISDKDGPDYYNCRLVWIPDVLSLQIEHYAEHRKVMLSHLIHNKKNIPKLSDLPDLFFVDEELGAVEVRPKTIAEKLETLLPLPVNSNRRYLRTHLIQNACPPEIVDAFMGHWSRGEEPWGRYSSLSYQEIVDNLKVYLLPLISELGFKAKRSLCHDL